MTATRCKMKVVRSDGQVLVANEELTSGWIIKYNGLEGFDGMDYSVSTSKNVLSDGSSLVSKRVEEKDRTVTCFYMGRNGSRAARTECTSFFNPKHSYRLYLDFDGVTRWCEGELYAFSCPPERLGAPVEFTFTLLCLDPYWRDEFPNDKSFGSAEPRFGFPFVSHVREKLPDGTKRPVGFVVSEMLFDGVGNVYNSGDVPTFYRVRMRFSGDVKNPKIAKDGRYVRMVKDFKAGDELVIDFEASPPRVTVNGENAIQLADRSSSFTKMAMAVGKNEFRFSCDNPENRSLAKVTVEHYKKYLGV